MSKYITAEQVNNVVALCKDKPFSKANIFAITELLPSADVVEVVRCKDCVFNGHNGLNGNYAKCCRETLNQPFMELDDFCSRGERKDEE